MAGMTIKGSVSIEVDLQGLEAKLSFSPNKEGEDWNGELVMKAMGEKRLTPLPSPKAIEELLQKIAKAKQPVSVSLMKGAPAEPPVPERIVWADLPIPEDMATLVDDVLAKAKPPELYRIRVDKEKKETLVKKPAALPFLPPKEEIVVTWEKKETKEKAIVDGVLTDKAYALKGIKAGTLSPPKPGKPGKSVYGKPIPPPMDGDGPFLLGETLVRDKSDIKAAASGILRIGKNWADIIPFAKPVWKAEKGSDGASIYLHYEPGDSRLPPASAGEILAAALAAGGRQEDLISEAELQSALDRAGREKTVLEAMALSVKKDAQALVVVSPDKLRAQLYLRKAMAGAAPLDLKAISAAIRDARVRGFNAEKVKADILAFHKGPEIELKDYLLVEGKGPTRGKDKEIKLALAFMPQKEAESVLSALKAKPRGDDLAEPPGAFSPGEATGLAWVEQGAVVAQVTQPPSGTAGVDVFGTALPGIPGNDPEIKLHHGVHLRGADIVADETGLLLAKQEGTNFAAFVVAYKDSLVEVVISGDAMQATLRLERQIGAGRALSAEAIYRTLGEAGVVQGVQGTVVAEALLIALETGSCPPTVVAAGEAPVAGGSSSLKWLVALAANKGVTIREDGRADFKNQSRFVSVVEGTPVAEILRQGAEGKAGFTVAGKALDPEKGEALVLEHDDTLREEPIEGGIRLFAARTGELVYEGASVRINSLHGIKGDVGLATGNVNFTGEVRVSGKVNPGFAVMGGQDVLIGETAEAALVSAGGKVVIGQGVIGAGKGIVRAKKTIEAAFVEQATLLAVEDIKVKNGCLMCNIKTNGKLVLVGEKGNLIGGVCRSRFGVDAANIGSERGGRSEISFGQDYLIHDQIEVTERELEKAKKALVDLESMIKKLEESHASLDMVRAEKVRLMKIIEKNGMRLFTLREKFEEHHPSEIRVRGTIFPGVVMESHGRYYEVKQKRSQVVFFFDKEVGRIQEKPLTR